MTSFEMQEQYSLQDSLLSDVSSMSIEQRSRSRTLNKTVKWKLEQFHEKNVMQEEQEKIQRVIKIYDDNLNDEHGHSDNNFFEEYLSWLPVILPKRVWPWKIFVAITTLFVFFEVPIYVMYGEDFWKELINAGGRYALFYGIFIILLTDMLLDFVTSYYKHGNLVLDKRKIAMHYFYGYFVFDCVALFSCVVRLAVDTNNFRFIFFMFYFKLPSLLRIDHQIAELILLHKRLRTFYQITKMLIFMFFCFNFYCCIWYVLGIYGDKIHINTWLNVPGNFGIIKDKSIHEIYFYSFYFSLNVLSTTMGFGDISPMNIYECSFALFGVMFAVVVFALNINNFQKMMEEYNSYYMQRFKQKVSINKFMEQKNVPSELRERIRQYINEHWAEEGSRDQESEQQVFEILAPELKQELMYQSLGQFLQRTMFANHFTKPFLKELAQKIREQSFSQGDEIIGVGSTEQTDDLSIYYIVGGSVIVKPGNSEIIKKKLGLYSYFGEWSFFTGFPRTGTVNAREYSQVYAITRADFLETLKKFPEDFEMYCQIRDKLLFTKEYNLVEQQCYTCNNSDHYADQCPKTHYIPLVQELIEESTVLDLKQDRVKIQRFDRKQWATRANATTLIKGLNNNKLKKKANLMLKTQRALKKNTVKIDKPLIPQWQVKEFKSLDEEQAANPMVDDMTESQNLNYQSIDNDIPQRQQQNQQLKSFAIQTLTQSAMQQSALISSKVVENSNQSQQQSRDNMLAEYQKILQPTIKTGVEQFDAPANYKNYYRKYNSNNYQEFKNIKIIEKNKIQNMRQSIILK
ncbi:unnamed protein product [Paramecium pentaurelia]|uniref:Cyclic nucleotide-binding domain-containing protein n=1 Tax=Paramecium pentaurelia TaxID=43138 RepID=A0A8S1WV44_9CILI|nr:unnamed protein product [Paramecium pentaurelia]